MSVYIFLEFDKQKDLERNEYLRVNALTDILMIHKDNSKILAHLINKNNESKLPILYSNAVEKPFCFLSLNIACYLKNQPSYLVQNSKNHLVHWSES